MSEPKREVSDVGVGFILGILFSAVIHALLLPVFR